MYYSRTHYITATLIKELPPEITGTLDRGNCGWYRLYAYYLQPDTKLEADGLYLEESDENGYLFRLSLVEFNLAEYADSSLDNASLENIRQVLKRFSRTKSKVIVRFLYDWDGLGMEREPKDISIVETHMEQIGTILTEYSDTIYTTQGIFVGSWAEMHDSKYLSTKDMTRLLLCYAHATSPSIYLAVRTPNQYRAILDELEKNPDRYQEFDVTIEELKNRLGLFNDGLLGSASDVGTYQDASVDEKELRKRELSFQNELCLRVPNGGEAVIDNEYNDWENAVADLRTMHVSYLNQLYDSAVIDKWKNSTYEQMDSIYHGCSVYDYITEHMGARFVLKACSLSYRPYRDELAQGSITIENTGFSNLYHSGQFILSFINQETGTVTVLADSRQDIGIPQPNTWNSGETVTIPFFFSPFDLGEGSYTLIAVLKDDTGEDIFSFANDGYQETLGGYPIGTVLIQR